MQRTASYSSRLPAATFDHSPLLLVPLLRPLHTPDILLHPGVNHLVLTLGTLRPALDTLVATAGNNNADLALWLLLAGPAHQARNTLCLFFLGHALLVGEHGRLL